MIIFATLNILFCSVLCRTLMCDLQVANLLASVRKAGVLRLKLPCGGGGTPTLGNDELHTPASEAS